MSESIESMARKRANRKLAALGNYHYGLALVEIDDILESEGFNPLEPAIYCGADGHTHAQVGAKTWISLSWHKMESGRYEVVVYLS